MAPHFQCGIGSVRDRLPAQNETTEDELASLKGTLALTGSQPLPRVGMPQGTLFGSLL